MPEQESDLGGGELKVDSERARLAPHVQSRVRAFLGERPLLAIFGAVVAGYIAGRLLSRAMR